MPDKQNSHPFNEGLGGGQKNMIFFKITAHDLRGFTKNHF